MCVCVCEGEGGREGRREVLVSVHIFTHIGRLPWLVYIVHTAQCLVHTLAAAHYSINLPHPDYLSPIYYIFSSCLCTNDNASHFMSLILQVSIPHRNASF